VNVLYIILITFFVTTIQNILVFVWLKERIAAYHRINKLTHSEMLVVQKKATSLNGQLGHVVRQMQACFKKLGIDPDAVWIERCRENQARKEATKNDPRDPRYGKA